MEEDVEEEEEEEDTLELVQMKSDSQRERIKRRLSTGSMKKRMMKKSLDIFTFHQVGGGSPSHLPSTFSPHFYHIHI